MGRTKPRLKQIRVGIVAIPDGGIATLTGIFDVLNSLALLAGRDGVPDPSPFQVEILGETADPVRLASGVTLPVPGQAGGRPSDVVIVPSVLVREGGWETGRYPHLARWITDPKSPQKHVWRARIVLLSGEGLGTSAIMVATSKSKTCVWRWQERFMQAGAEGVPSHLWPPSPACSLNRDNRRMGIPRDLIGRQNALAVAV